MILPASRRLNFDEIAVIDLGTDPESDIKRIATEVRSACQGAGFFYVSNHGIDPATIHNIQYWSRQYFAQPLEEKSKVLINHQIRGYLPSGYKSYEGEERSGSSSQEGFWIGYEQSQQHGSPLDGPNTWPAQPVELKSAMLAYLVQAESLSGTLLQAFAVALGLEPASLLSHFSLPCSRLKLNHYPPDPKGLEEDMFGVVPHTDSGAFTIFVAGSQRRPRSSKGGW